MADERTIITNKFSVMTNGEVFDALQKDLDKKMKKSHKAAIAWLAEESDFLLITPAQAKARKKKNARS